MERKIALSPDWTGISLVAMRDGALLVGAATNVAAGSSAVVGGVTIWTATLNIAGASAGVVDLYWRNAAGDIAAVESIYIDGTGAEATEPTTAALIADAATAATEIGKVHRSATPVAAGAAMRRTKAAATSSTLDETVGPVP